MQAGVESLPCPEDGRRPGHGFVLRVADSLEGLAPLAPSRRLCRWQILALGEDLAHVQKLQSAPCYAELASTQLHRVAKIRLVQGRPLTDFVDSM